MEQGRVVNKHLFSVSSAILLALLSLPWGGRSVTAADLQTIRQRGYLVVAVKDNMRPLGYRNGANQLQGLEIDIAQRLAEELLGRRDALKLQPVANSDRLTAVLNDQVDLTIARVTATKTRTRIVSFSAPYYMDGTALLTRSERVTRFADLVRQPIAVLNGSATIPTIRSLLPQANLVGVDSYQAGLNLLESGQAMSFAGDASVLSGWVQEFPQYRLLSPLLSAEPLAVVMPKGLQYDSLRRQVNSAIDRWRKEGWLQQRAAYWGLPVDGLAAATLEMETPAAPAVP